MLNPDYKDILSCLKNARAEFLIVGAYALAFYGRPRATGGFDIWVNPSVENAPRVARALAEFGTPFTHLSADDFAEPNIVVQIGVAPCRVDILTSIDGVEFDDAYRRRAMASIDGMELPILSKQDLLANKLATNRRKDQDDIDWLRRHLA